VVSGGGSKTPSGASATTFYKRTDAGILIDIYNNLVSYVIPGPAVQAFWAGFEDRNSLGCLMGCNKRSSLSVEISGYRGSMIERAVEISLDNGIFSFCIKDMHEMFMISTNDESRSIKR
jgi:hypothetical protein